MLSQSKNVYVNMLVRVPAKALIYGVSIFIGQFAARTYWIYKRSFRASLTATLDAYFQYNLFTSGKKYKYFQAFAEMRPKLIS